MAVTRTNLRASSGAPVFDVVIPTVGRPTLRDLLRSLGEGDGPMPRRIYVVHNSRGGAGLPLDGLPRTISSRVRVLHAAARGPAAARNVGWRASAAEWVVFLDDDVLPDPGWRRALIEDLRAVGPAVAGSQAGLRVPLPSWRRPTDWERNVRRLEGALWTTADMAYRRAVLQELGGFDERFPRAYREDSDLALRALRAGHRLVRGRRRTTHPVRPEAMWVSVRQQAGNADDVLMRALHGHRQARAEPRGRRRRHVLVTAAAAGAIAAVAASRRRVALALGAAWFGGTAEFAWSRIRPGPRSGREVATMISTSIAIPPTATAWWLVGLARRRRLLAKGGPSPG